MRVLLAEDDPRAAINEMLANWSMLADVANGFDAALAMFDEASRAGQPFALAILDADFSGGRGLELAEVLQARAAKVRPAILVMDSTPGNRTAASVDAYLTKPVKQCELMDAISTTVASVSLQRLCDFRQPASWRARRTAGDGLQTRA